MKRIKYQFTAKIRKLNKSKSQWVINFPKEYHERIEEDSEYPHQVEVTARILYPK